MFPAQRIALLKKIVSEQKSVDVATLCSHLQVSDVTVRKYLDKLEQEGFLIKMHGGAMLAENEADENQENTLGDIEKIDDGLIINGKDRLHSAEVSSFGDHRIAMSAAIAATVCDGDVIVTGAEATAKSYPAFWDDLSTLGVTITKDEE